MLIECGEQRTDHSLALGAERDGHSTLVVTVGGALDQLLTLERLDDTGESPFGDTGLFCDVAGLLRSPDPQDPQDREGRPTEVVVGQYGALHVIANGRSSSVHVGDGAHGYEIELAVLETVADVGFGLEHFFGSGRRNATTHDE